MNEPIINNQSSIINSLAAIIFDLDDTLLLEVPSAEAAFIETCKLAQEKYRLDPHELHTMLRQEASTLWHTSPARPYCVRISVSSWEGLWARYEGDDPNLKILRDWAPTYRQQSWSNALARFDIHDADFARTLAEEFPRQRRSRHVVFDDVVPTLRTLQGRFKLGLITNGLSCLQREKITGSGLSPYFDAIVISGDIGVAKPDPAIFREVLRRLNVGAQHALMVGNGRRTDISGAQAANMKGMLINRGDPHGSDDIALPDYTIDSLDELLQYLP